MKINKSLNIDLNIISPQKHIRIHEGDVDSVDILIGVTVDDESVDLTGVTIKYDATINNYLAEQDANGSVVDDKISIPVTQNMTAMSGLLLIDVRMIQNDQILFTQTICATVEKAVVNGSTYIDFDKITIIQRMNALEEKMDYIEELVENFDTSKLIVSANRPPMGAPVEVDVDLLRVGDTWILSGANIVYKLVEAQYNYQPFPSAEPYHKFTWQPLNERYGVGNTEPPTSVTYQEVIYTINEVQWSWLAVPEYFKGDHYLMQIGVGEPPTYYICKSGTMRTAGVCTYTWREEGGSIDAYTKAETNVLLADKMDLAPLNPTAEQIAAMPSGQLYGDTVNHKGVIKGGQEFYDANYITSHFGIITGQNPEYGSLSGEVGQIAYYGGEFYRCFGETGSGTYVWKKEVFPDSATIYATFDHLPGNTGWLVYSAITQQEVANMFKRYGFVKILSKSGLNPKYCCLILTATSTFTAGIMLPVATTSIYKGKMNILTQSGGSSDYLELSTAYVSPDLSQYYTKTEIDSMIGDIETALSEV